MAVNGGGDRKGIELNGVAAKWHRMKGSVVSMKKNCGEWRIGR
jgi:hypothetical protein